MSSIRFPLGVLSVSKFSSAQELRARESARQEAGPALEAIESFKQSRDVWINHVQSRDGTTADSASDEQGLVLLEQARYHGGIHPSATVTAESSASADGYVNASHINCEEYSDHDVSKTNLSYIRTGQREVYTETSNKGGLVKLVIDHEKGIVSFDAPNFESFAERESETCLSRPATMTIN